MGTLAFGIAGAVVGSFFGMPQLGFVVGSLLGSLLFPPAGPAAQQGPRLGDLSVQSSTFGAPIPEGYGTYRMSGNMIWAKPIREQQNSTNVSSGGKGLGGPSQTQITYTYFGSFDIAFAAGPAVAVLRIWADKKLVFDGRPSTFTNSIGTFRFYPGDEDQLPDAIIEAQCGVGLAPGNRGLVHIVFDDIPLANFGNRMPNIEAEIGFAAVPANSHRYATYYSTAQGGIFAGQGSTGLAVDRKRRRIYVTGAGSSGGGVRVFDMDAFTEFRQADTEAIYGTSDTFNFLGGFTVGDSGFIYSGLAASNSDPITQVDNNTLTEVNRFGIFSSSTSGAWPPNTVQASAALCEAAVLDPIANGRLHFLASLSRSAGGFGSNVTLMDVEQGDIIWESDDHIFLQAISMVAEPVTTHQAAWWIADQDSTAGNNSILVYELVCETSYTIQIPDTVTNGISLDLIDTITADAWNNDGATSQQALGPILDQRDGGLIFIVKAGIGNGCYVFKWQRGPGVVWTTKMVTGAPAFNASIAINSQVTNSRFGWVDNGSSAKAALIDTTTGAIIVDNFVIDSSTFALNAAQFFDGDSQSVIALLTSARMGQVYLGRNAGQSTTLQAIVEDISARVNLDVDADIDASELADDEVIGYAITQHMAAADALQPLAMAFFFDGVESDGKIVFKKRSRDTERTLTKSTLMYVDDGGQNDDIVRETRIQEVELPQSLSINFIDVDLDYQADSVSATRVGDPLDAGIVARNRRGFTAFRVPKGTVKSFDRQIVNFAIVFTAAQAAQIVEAMLFSTWNERMTETFRADQTQLDLDPGDVIDLDLENGTVLTTRIVKATLNADFSTSFQALKMNKITLVSTRSAIGGLGLPQQLPPGNGLTLLFLLDIPLLRDFDDTGGRATRLYSAMNGYTANWPGGALWSSDASVSNFTPTGVRNAFGVSYGTISNVLPATAVPFQTDNVTQLRVYMTSGTLSSATQLDFLNDVNVALVGTPGTNNWELINFKNAVQQDDGSYVVSTIMRGRRGTETQCNTHVNGEYFLIPTPTTLASYIIPLSVIGVSKFYRGVGNTEIVENADTEALTARGNDLKPYAPCQLDATTNGTDITIDWERRTRISGALTDGHGDVPLAEETESYSIEIFSGSSVVRTLTSSTTTVIYLHADIVTDFGSVPASITFAVYQISAAVGRGFQAKTTITF